MPNERYPTDAEIRERLGPKPTTSLGRLAQIVRLATDEPDDKIAITSSFGIYEPGVAHGLTYGDLRQMLLLVTDGGGYSEARGLALREISRERG